MSEFKYNLNEWPGPVCKCGSCELCKFNDIWTVFAIARWLNMPTLFYCLEDISIHMRMICIFTYVFTCMNACVYLCVYALIVIYACMYMCTLMFLILICVCILSSFHDHHMSTNSRRLIFLFEDCATVNKVYLILQLSCNCLCPVHWSQALSREWRCSWSSDDRRCSNYIWVINNFIAH